MTRALLVCFLCFDLGGDLLAVGIQKSNSGPIVFGIAAISVPLALAVSALVHLAVRVGR